MGKHQTIGNRDSRHSTHSEFLVHQRMHSLFKKIPHRNLSICLLSDFLFYPKQKRIRHIIFTFCHSFPSFRFYYFKHKWSWFAQICLRIALFVFFLVHWISVNIRAFWREGLMSHWWGLGSNGTHNSTG